MLGLVSTRTAVDMLVGMGIVVLLDVDGAVVVDVVAGPVVEVVDMSVVVLLRVTEAVVVDVVTGPVAEVVGAGVVVLLAVRLPSGLPSLTQMTACMSRHYTALLPAN